MPLIFQGKCTACEYATHAASEGYTAVIVDAPSCSTFVHPENARLVILAHPLESTILDELGYTSTAVALGGRFVDVTKVSCADCGTMYELRRLYADSRGMGCTGCLVMLAVSVCIGAIAGWKSHAYFGLLAGGLALWVLVASADVVLSRLVRWRYRERAKEFDCGPGCPKCHSKNYATFPPRRGKLVCPKCGQRTVKVDTIGRS